MLVALTLPSHRTMLAAVVFKYFPHTQSLCGPPSKNRSPDDGKEQARQGAACAAALLVGQAASLPFEDRQAGSLPYEMPVMYVPTLLRSH
jgi:hypothetical protein